MMLPTVHLNGTSRQALIDSYRSQYEAVDNALRVLSSEGPNARDYYPQDPTPSPVAYNVAACEHSNRIDALRKVRDELYGILEHLLDHT